MPFMGTAQAPSKTTSGSRYPSVGVDASSHPHLSPPASSRISSANLLSDHEIKQVNPELYAASTPLGLECALGRLEKQQQFLERFARTPEGSKEKRALQAMSSFLKQHITAARSQGSFEARHLAYTSADDVLIEIRKSIPDSAKKGLDQVLKDNPFSVPFSSTSFKAAFSGRSRSISQSQEAAPVSHLGGLNNIGGNNCFINGSLQLVKTLARDLQITHVDGMPMLSKFFQNNPLSEQNLRALHLEIKPLLDANTDLRGALEGNRQEDARPLLLALLERCNIPSFAVQETQTSGDITKVLTHEHAVTGAATPLREQYFDLMPPASQRTPVTIQQIVNQSLIDHPIIGYNASGNATISSTKTTFLASKEAAPQVLTLSIGRFSQELIRKEDGSVEFHGIKNSNPVSGLLNAVTIPIAGGSSVTYEPTSVLCHIGAELRPGHYITYRKENDLWMKYNDSHVSVATAEELEQIKREAYFISYRKKEVAG